MLQQQEFIHTTSHEYEQIKSVREWIQNLHVSGNFFSLSLKTLELIRRFNKLYVQVIEQEDRSPSNVNQLMIISKGLEMELIGEI